MKKTIIPNITYKSVLTGMTIAQRNFAFNHLDRRSQRLETAWEALNIAMLPNVKAANGEYWSDSLCKIEGTSKELQKHLIKSLPQCEVCQRGLLMLSQIRLGNSIDSEDDDKEDGCYDNIRGFEFEDFLEMEREYESSRYGHPYDRRTKEKLMNICCNVLVNGNFNIKDKNDYLTVTES